jgi:hypothetical protein
MRDKLVSILVNEHGYSEYSARVTANDLIKLDPQLYEALDRWMAYGMMTEVEVANFSTGALMRDKGFTYPAALIAMDWLLKEPQVAAKELSKDVNR